MLKVFQRFFPEVESFKSSWLWFLNFSDKIYLAIIIFGIGIFGLGFIICQQFADLHRQLLKSNQINQQLDAIKDLKYQSTLLLNRCIAAARDQKTIDLGDSLINLNKTMIRLTDRLNIATGVLTVKAYNEFTNKPLIYYSIYELDRTHYWELKHYYQNFYGKLFELEHELVQNQAGLFWMTIFTGCLLFIGAVLLLLIIIVFSGGLVMITSIKTITEPVALITKNFRGTNVDTGLSLAGIATEGLGTVAFHLKEAVPVWKDIFTELRDVARRLEEHSQNLVGGIRVQGISEVQIFEAHRAIDSYVAEQIKMTGMANEQTVFLISNLSTLQRIPFELKTFVAQMQNLLNAMETKLGAAINTKLEFKDCSIEINSLFEDLSLAAAKIIEVVTILKEAAGQAELLAFNTAIEAARAGNKGLGFGVVSQEIAKLGERSKNTAVNLDLLIAQVRNEIAATNNLIPLATISTETAGSFQLTVTEAYTGTYNTIRSSINDLQRLALVFDDIITKSSEITRQANQIANLDFYEKEELNKMELEILDYQLNVKESVRIANKVEEIVKELNLFLLRHKMEK